MIQYESPEKVQGSLSSSKEDSWALGVIIYKLCSLEWPFRDLAAGSLINSLLSKSFAPLPSARSQDLLSLVSALLSKTPEQRPSIMQLLKDSPVLLEACIDLIANLSDKKMFERLIEPIVQNTQIDSEVREPFILKTVTDAEGNTYTGQFYKGRRHGKGKIIYSESDKMKEFEG